MKAIGYVRVSTEEQADSGVSLEVQRDRVKSYCRAKEWELLETISDPGSSGKNLRRDGIQKVLSLCRKQDVDVVVVAKLDRLTRHVADLGYLTRDIFTKNGVALASVVESIDTTTAAGQLMLNILGSVAQWERDIISERTRDALAFKQRNGERVGAIPYGYNLGMCGRILVRNETEQKVINNMTRMRRRGLSYQIIADRLNTSDIISKTGCMWYSKTVRSVLIRAKQGEKDR